MLNKTVCYFKLIHTFTSVISQENKIYKFLPELPRRNRRR